MNNSVIKLFLVSLFVFSIHLDALADCRRQEMPYHQQENGRRLGVVVAHSLGMVEQSMRAQGKDFKVAIIARQGSTAEKLNSSEVYSPHYSYNGQDYLINGQLLPVSIDRVDMTPTPDEATELLSRNAERLRQFGLLNEHDIIRTYLAETLDRRGQPMEFPPAVSAPMQASAKAFVTDALGTGRRARRWRHYRRTNESIQYSHIGFAVIDPELAIPSSPRGQWVVKHLLRSCDDEEGQVMAIHKSGMITFMQDKMWRYAVKIIVPDQELSNGLYDILVTNRRGNSFLGQNYNVAVRPFNVLQNMSQEQNSNQWPVEIISAASARGINDRSAAQSQLYATGYSGTFLKLTGMIGGMMDNMITRGLLATFFPDDVGHFRDQPERHESLIEAITAESIEEYLRRTGSLETFSVNGTVVAGSFNTGVDESSLVPEEN